MNILIIEDSPTVRSIIEKTLVSYGHTPHCLSSQQPVRRLIGNIPATFIIVSTSLRHENAVDLCSHIRTLNPDSFILAIHARGPWQDRIDILNKGADDCLSFPFPTQELQSRINALLRRPKTSVMPVMQCGNITVNPDRKTAEYSKKPVDLTRKEYSVLEYLIRNKERTVTRDELLDHVWDYRKIIGSNTIDVHIQKIRRKMKRAGETHEKKSGVEPASQSYSPHALTTYTPLEIKTVHGIGYRLEENIVRPEDKMPLPPL